MRVIVQFSDFSDYITRGRPGDLFIIAREENGKVVTQGGYRFKEEKKKNGELQLEYLTPPAITEQIKQAEKINVEILGHSSKGAKQIQSDATPDYPKQFIGIDKLTQWVEQDLLQDEIARSTISFLSCQAANGSEKNPALAEQMFALFEKKPKKITAREGFLYLDKDDLYSLGTFDLILKSAIDAGSETKSENMSLLKKISYPLLRGVSKFYQYSEDTPLNEKFVYYQDTNGKTIKADKQLYDLLIEMNKKQDNLPERSSIKATLSKKFEDISQSDFKSMAKIGITTNKDEKLHIKSKRVLEGTIKSPTVIETNISSFKTKTDYIKTIQSMRKLIDTKKDVDNIEILSKILNKTQEFIEYRQLRNYPITNLNELINTLQEITSDNCVVTEKNLNALVQFSNQIKSNKQINLDVSERLSTIGLRPPSYKKEVQAVTITKNTGFSNCLNEFTGIIIKNNLASNWTILDKLQDDDALDKTEENEDDDYEILDGH